MVSQRVGKVFEERKKTRGCVRHLLRHFQVAPGNEKQILQASLYDGEMFTWEIPDTSLARNMMDHVMEYLCGPQLNVALKASVTPAWDSLVLPFNRYQLRSGHTEEKKP